MMKERFGKDGVRVHLLEVEDTELDSCSYDNVLVLRMKAEESRGDLAGLFLIVFSVFSFVSVVCHIYRLHRLLFC
jgi:hypothetical protein